MAHNLRIQLPLCQNCCGIYLLHALFSCTWNTVLLLNWALLLVRLRRWEFRSTLARIDISLRGTPARTPARTSCGAIAGILLSPLLASGARLLKLLLAQFLYLLHRVNNHNPLSCLCSSNSCRIKLCKGLCVVPYGVGGRGIYSIPIAILLGIHCYSRPLRKNYLKGLPLIGCLVCKHKHRLNRIGYLNIAVKLCISTSAVINNLISPNLLLFREEIGILLKGNNLPLSGILPAICLKHIIPLPSYG